MSYPKCFGCGSDNPIGLKLKFIEDGDLFYTDFIPLEDHQGYDRMVHGGITTAVLDELMANHVMAKGIWVVTVEIQVRFLYPLPIGEKVRFISRIVSFNRRLYEVEAWAELHDGTVAAKAHGKMIPVKDK
ncbi:MAG: PaaI family thioesterase [Bacillota bacterium]